MTLDKVAVGGAVKIARLNGAGPVKRRIMDMGLTKGMLEIALFLENSNIL